MNSLLKRTLTGVIFVAVLAGAILSSQYSFLLLFFLITVLGAWEFYALLLKNNLQPLRVYNTILSGIIYLLFTCIVLGYLAVEHLWLITFLVLSVFIIELYRKSTTALANIAHSVFGLLYIVLPFSLFIRIAFIDNTYQPAILIGILIIIWANDTFAYLVGKNFGRHKLFERISPKKTWEGFAGGAIISVVVAFLIAHYFEQLGTIDWLIIAIITIIFGMLGDLFESLLKRSFNNKDSGNILPGHGGLLDRFDSFLFIIPVIYSYLQLISE